MTKPCVEEFEEIAKRLKEIQEEKPPHLPDWEPADLPSDVEAAASLSIGEYWARYGKALTAEIESSLKDVVARVERDQARGYDMTLLPTETLAKAVSIYGDPFWDALVRNGVIKIGEC